MAGTMRSDDEPARRRILEDLGTNILVEAGAGSGKTTSLVGRMVALVERGTTVESIAAVTFTRKAANELRERFQIELERRVRDGQLDPLVRERCDRALHDSDRAFLGTIHAFCGRLLRERPLEIGLDPNFAEVAEGDWDELIAGFWRRWIEDRIRGDDPALAALAGLRIDARSLLPAFREVMKYPEVEFPLGEAPRPDHRACRARLEKLLAYARALMPRDEPEGGWDDLMRLIRRLRAHQRTCDWDDVAQFCEAVTGGTRKVVLKRWADDAESKAAVKALCQQFVELYDGDIAELLRAWYEHRYPPVMTFLRRAAADFADERHATGQLGFEDLLMLAAKLLREHPRVRDELGRRYARLLVDEFQDTDPIQAEVCLLLASDPSEGTDWRKVRPRPGSIFVVGDPKQSIYRFRRADIQIYNLVRDRFAAFGDVLALTRNFRSVHGIAGFVNAHFANAFPREATPQQAAFRTMETQHEDVRPAVRYYDFTIPSQAPAAVLLQEDARIVANVIADRIANGAGTAGDFLVLTTRKEEIAYYARALGRRNVPVTTTGAKLPQEYELRELLAVLHCIADPDNSVLVAAALEGMFFGLPPAALYAARRSGAHFSITHPPTSTEGAAARALLQLHEWWKMSQRHAADVVVERIFQDTGMLFAAASEPMGDARAGALIHLVEVLRTSSTSGASGIVDAMDRIAVLLDTEAPDAQLRPGRSDAVRVMNLHKAKGLEAAVVFLAAPRRESEFEPTAHVSRTTGGEPTGWLKLCTDDGTVIAQPPGWAEHASREQAFEAGEEDRLLYVAATRAKEELIVARCTEMTKEPKAVESAWRPFDAALAAHGMMLAPATAEAGERAACTQPLSAILEAIAASDRRRAAASVASFATATVTASAREERESSRSYDLPTGRGLGAAWGRAVHRAIEGMGRGRRDGQLARFVAAVARDEGLGPEMADRLQRLLTIVAASPAWRELTAAGTPAFELAVMRAAADGSREVVTQGVIDAAVRDAGGWHVVDWKSDTAGDAAWTERAPRYAQQVEVYARMLAELTGVPATGQVERVQVE